MYQFSRWSNRNAFRQFSYKVQSLTRILVVADLKESIMQRFQEGASTGNVWILSYACNSLSLLWVEIKVLLARLLLILTGPKSRLNRTNFGWLLFWLSEVLAQNFKLRTVKTATNCTSLIAAHKNGRKFRLETGQATLLWSALEFVVNFYERLAYQQHKSENMHFWLDPSRIQGPSLPHGSICAAFSYCVCASSVPQTFRRYSNEFYSLTTH